MVFDVLPLILNIRQLKTFLYSLIICDLDIGWKLSCARVTLAF